MAGTDKIEGVVRKQEGTLTDEELREREGETTEVELKEQQAREELADEARK